LRNRVLIMAETLKLGWDAHSCPGLATYDRYKTRRLDHLMIDHKTKSVMVTDYTVSYNNPMSGSFKVDHRTKTAFYLEAFLAQQKKLGRD
jgi:hypothetical protein